MNQLQVRNEEFNLTPRNLEEAMQYAKLIADSDLAPKDYKGKPGNVIIAIQMGAEIGLKPMQSLQNIAVINGRASLWGDAMLAVVKVHPEFEDINEYMENGTAYCTVMRRGQEAQTQSFSPEQAKKAGLWGKQGPWQQYPERMLQMRARGFALRNVFPDALRGLNLAEESRDIPREIEVSESKKTYAETANQLLSLEYEKSENFEQAFETCKTLDEMKVLFDDFKKRYKDPKNLAAMLHAKNKRKKELEVIEPIETKVIENTQSNEEWVKDYSEEK